MKYYIIAGEASGDLHGSNLIKHLKQLDTKPDFRCFGGDRMAAAGGNVVRHYSQMAFMGFLEVAMNINVVLSAIKFAKKDIQEYTPDVVVLIDFPGFNLRIARFAKLAGFKVVYYISPQVWAWKASRIKTIKRFVDEMIVILPFEKKFYASHGMDVSYVGHPLLDVLNEQQNTDDAKQSFKSSNSLSDDPVIAILPGSRKQEILKVLPVMLDAAKEFRDYQLLIAGAPSIDRAFYELLIKNHSSEGLTTTIKYVQNQTYELLGTAYAALVTSGTATLETALCNVPQVVCYKGSWFSFTIGKLLVQVPFIALVNLVMERKIVSELVQADLNKDMLIKELKAILNNSTRKTIFDDYKVLKEKLGGQGASKQAAQLVYDHIK